MPRPQKIKKTSPQTQRGRKIFFNTRKITKSGGDWDSNPVFAPCSRRTD